jgi:hypothetical protein
MSICKQHQFFKHETVLGIAIAVTRNLLPDSDDKDTEGNGVPYPCVTVAEKQRSNESIEPVPLDADAAI